MTKYLTVFKYEVHVYTGSEHGSDTEANVYCQLMGKKGDTGKRGCIHSTDDRILFQKGQVSERSNVK